MTTLAVLLTLALAGCAGVTPTCVATMALAGCESDRERGLKAGMLMLGQDQDDFLAMWGRPVRTQSALSAEELSVRWGWSSGIGGRGNVFKGRRPLEVWMYDGVELVFDDGDLVAWRTERTVEQLRALGRRAR